MSDELRAAAERCRGLEGPGWVDCENAPVECVADLLALARGWLAEHPADDGEAVTEEWLRTIAPNPGFYFPFGDECGLWFVFNPDGRYMQVSDGVNTGAELAMPPTRGDLRRLVAALGIPLTPPD